MSKLEEAAYKYWLSTDEDDLRPGEGGFIAGALWLLEQAIKESGIYAESVKPCVFLEDLEKLCQSKEE